MNTSAGLGEKSARLGEKSARLGEKFARLGEKFARLGEKSARLGENPASAAFCNKNGAVRSAPAEKAAKSSCPTENGDEWAALS